MPSPNLARSARKLEDLPSDGGRVVDTLAGAMLRVFVRLNEMERAFGKFRARVGSSKTEPQRARRRLTTAAGP
jgi:hypothetical protein